MTAGAGPDLVIVTKNLVVSVDELAAVDDYLAAEKSPSTLAAYRADFDDFRVWCSGVGVESLPASPIDVARSGEGQTIAIPQGSKLRPMQAVRAWLEASRIAEGPLFRPIGKGGALKPRRLAAGSVAAIVKRYARAAGIDEAMLSGHSLRAGFVTSALEAGSDLLRIMDVTRHASVNSLKAYDRRSKGFKHHAGRDFL
jgi:site-specific recombinase XerD